MRSFSLLKEAMLPYFEVLINNLASKLMLVSKVKDIFLWYNSFGERAIYKILKEQITLAFFSSTFF